MTVLHYMHVLEKRGNGASLPTDTLLDRAAVSATKVLQQTFAPTVTIRGVTTCFSDLRYDKDGQKLSLRCGVAGGRPYWENVHPHPLILEELCQLYESLLEARLDALAEDVADRDYFNVWTKK